MRRDPVDDSVASPAPAVGSPAAASPAQASPAPAVEGRFDGIQALRFVAAVLVVITHSTFYTHERLDRGLPVWNAGVAGVDIFFVISGFVIVIASRSLMDRPDGAREFTLRRIVRIVPLYWIATTINLAVLLLAPAAVLHSDRDWWHIASSYLFLPAHNTDGKIEPLLGVGWTLVFEMFFYAVFALAMLLRRNVFVVVGAVMLACSIGALWRQPDWPAISFYLSPRVLEFFAGMLLVPTVARRPLPRAVAIGAVVVGLFTLLAGPQLLAGLPQPLLLVKALPAVLVVAGTVSLERVLAPRLPSGLLFLGAASYAIYLFHPMIAPVVPAAMSRLGLDFPGAAAVAVAGAVTVATTGACVLHVVVERPTTARLNAWRRSRRAARTAARTA